MILTKFRSLNKSPYYLLLQRDSGYRSRSRAHSFVYNQWTMLSRGMFWLSTFLLDKKNRLRFLSSNYTVSVFRWKSKWICMKRNSNFDGLQKRAVTISKCRPLVYRHKSTITHLYFESYLMGHAYRGKCVVVNSYDDNYVPIFYSMRVCEFMACLHQTAAIQSIFSVFQSTDR